MVGVGVSDGGSVGVMLGVSVIVGEGVIVAVLVGRRVALGLEVGLRVWFALKLKAAGVRLGGGVAVTKNPPWAGAVKLGVKFSA